MAPGGGAISILLIEDSASDAEIARRALASSTDPLYAVRHVERLTRGLPLLAAGDIDVMLLDLGLPDSAGVATVERAHVMAEDVPIVVLTGTDDPELGLSCIEAGASDFVAKTRLDRHALGRAISYALERHRQRQLRELDETLARYRALVEAIGAGPDGQGEDAAPPVRNPRVAQLVEQHYRELLASYTEHVLARSPRASEAVTAVATILGELRAEPSDLMSCYVNAAEAFRRSGPPEQALLLAETGPQLILELLAGLLDYYRAGPRRPSTLPRTAVE